jgi:hypothetical protein
MKRTVLAWVLFIGGLGLELAIDYLLRIYDGDIKTGGIPELLLFLITIALASIAVWLAFTATKPLGSRWKRLVVVAPQAVVGYVVYAFIAIYYVCSTGIDCF